LPYGNPPPFTREAKSLRLACGNPPPFTREAELYCKVGCLGQKGRQNPTEELKMKYNHNKNLVKNAKVLRKDMTKEERHLWYDYLRNKDVRFLRQKIIGSYIVDFYCAKANLVIELDGSQHYEDKGIKYDAERTKFLEQNGLTVVRIPNNEINRNFDGVCEYLDSVLKSRCRTGD
jgi:very-short-patch-repair endonuclease